MANYGYPNNPVVPTNQDQQFPPAYGQAPASYGNYPPAQPDNQWSQAAAFTSQQQGANFQGFDQQNTYAANPQTNYSAAASDYNANFPSYGSGGYQGGMKKNDFGPKGGNPNFRGNNAGNNRNNSGPGFNKGPRTLGGPPAGGPGIEEQQDTIFVSGLSEETTEDELKDFFGSIGLIKMDKKTRKPKIWVYKDKETGKPKGEVTITYDDPPTASSAISWFNGKELNGCILTVQLAQRKNNFLNAGNRNSNFGGGGGGGGGPRRDFDRKGGNDRGAGGGGGGGAREGDWVCSSCQNNNFAWRDSCNRCKTEKPSSAGGGGSSGFGGGDRRNNNLPYERRGGGNQMNGSRDRGSFGGGPRNNNGRNPQDRSFGGGRDQRGGRNGGPVRNSSDNRRAGPY